ncbi:MAG TPA: hypothetical protein VFA54_07910 [Bryobacterales bacterium]|nr:hypothetical protein [Bryobacterales bacterium]
MRMLRLFWDAAVFLNPEVETLDEKHMLLCRAGELRNLWEQEGLENVEERPLEANLEFASFEDFWSPFLLGQGPAGAYVKRLAPEQVAALREELRRRLGPASQEPFPLPARAWAVRGTAGRQ